MNRSERRRAQRALRKQLKAQVGVSAKLAGYRVVGKDGSVKLAVGKQPEEKP